MIAATALSLALISLPGMAQQNNNTSKGQMKQSGSEVGRAGKSMGHNVKHGRVVRGGKHFGRGTKKAVKHAVS